MLSKRPPARAKLIFLSYPNGLEPRSCRVLAVQEALYGNEDGAVKDVDDAMATDNEREKFGDVRLD